MRKHRLFTPPILPLILAAAMLPAACASPDEPLSATYGDAVRQNVAAHIINPQPVYRSGDPLEHSGAREAVAVDRYQAGPPQVTRKPSAMTRLPTAGATGN